MNPAGQQRQRDVDGREEEDEEHRHLHERPRLKRPEARCDAGRPAQRDHVHEQREREEPHHLDAVSEHVHPERERDGDEDGGRHAPAGDRRQPVADEDRAAMRCGQHQTPREAVLEVARDAEAREHAAERSRLEEHEDELERRVAGGELEPGQVRTAGRGRPRTP